MQKTLYFLKNNEMNNDKKLLQGLQIYNEKILTIYFPIRGLSVEKSEDAFYTLKLLKRLTIKC